MITANISNALRKHVYKRDGYRCALCDDPRHLQIHHYIFSSQGGDKLGEQNMITLCPKCHALAHGNDIDGIGKTAEEMDQAIVEYLSDLYASEGIIWNPWDRRQKVVEWKF